MMSKQMFSEQLITLMSEFIYDKIKGKPITEANVRKSIRAFENMWLTSVREIKKIDKRKNVAIIKNIRTGTEQQKTLHWCRKNLQIVDYISESEKIDDWLTEALTKENK